jgi:large subunit ribosomal protein L21
MYAVIRTGGKQYKVAKGDVLQIERVGADDATIEFTPLFVVDDDGKSRSDKKALSAAKVTAKVLEESKGPKVDIFKYRNKTGYRRHNGHRQRYTTVEISDIRVGGSSSRKSTAKKTTRKKTTAKKTTAKTTAAKKSEES